jgi:hypothetical protein
VYLTPHDWRTKEAKIDLNLIEDKNAGGYSYDCSKCSKNYFCGNMALKYDYYKVSRRICNDCFADALDKMLGLDRSAKMDNVLYKGDNPNE